MTTTRRPTLTVVRRRTTALTVVAQKLTPSAPVGASVGQEQDLPGGGDTQEVAPPQASKDSTSEGENA